MNNLDNSDNINNTNKSAKLKYHKYKSKYTKEKIKKIRNYLLSLNYPFYNLYYKLDNDRIFDIGSNYSSVVENSVPNNLKNNKNIMKYGNKYVFLRENWENTSELNSVTDYFTEHCRIKCVFYNNKSPLEYWSNNKTNIINKIKINHDSDVSDLIFDIREQLFKNVKMCSNFKISVALQILKMFNAKKWLDISAGWGDRLISAIIHGLDLYCAVDPNDCLHEYYDKIIDTLDPNNKNRYILINDGFETAKLPDEKFDIVFSSPPFFDVEQYSQSEKDSITTYTSGDAWYYNFLMPSIKKACKYLTNSGNLILYMGEGKTYKYMGKMIRDINTFMDFEGAIYYYYDDALIARRFLIWKKIEK